MGTNFNSLRGGLMYLGPDTPVPVDRTVHAFDFDGTLASRDVTADHTQSQPYPHAVAHLQQLVQNGEIVIFSNQHRMDVVGLIAFERAIARMCDSIDACAHVPVHAHEHMRVFVATAHDRNRKPFDGMWKTFVRKYAPHVSASDVVFVGDAAGRMGDFSCSDRKFAYNCGFGFITPEVFFGLRSIADDAERYVVDGFDPSLPLISPTAQPALPALPSSEFHAVMLVGPPGSGKSTYARELERDGYCRISRDEVGSVGKCVNAALVGVLTHGRIVIDATNPTVGARREFLQALRKAEIPAYCVLFITPIDMSQHLAGTREYFGGTHIPPVAFAKYRASFEDPVCEEGFVTVQRYMPRFTFSRKFGRIFAYRQ